VFFGCNALKESVFVAFVFCRTTRGHAFVCEKVGDTESKIHLFSFLRLWIPNAGPRFLGGPYPQDIPYFLDRDKTTPVVVCSASPEFLVKPICEKLGVAHTIATRMN
jgi:hypothetical protein